MKYLRLIGNFLKNNYDKIILAILLIIFAVSLVFQTNDLQKTQLAVNQADQNLREQLPTNEIVSVDDRFLNAQIKPDETRMWRKAYGESSMVHPGKYVYSMDGSPYLLHLLTRRNPFTGKSDLPQEAGGISGSENDEQESEDSEDKDSDSDGIPDVVEAKLGLNKRDPGDSAGDLDNDGFSNIKEYNEGTDLNDAASHPKLISRLLFLKSVKKPVNIRLKGINTNNDPDDKTIWDIHVSYKAKKKWKSDFLKIGSQIGKTGYVINDAEFKENRRNKIADAISGITIQRGDNQPIKVAPKKKIFEHNIVYEFVFLFNKKTNLLKLNVDDEFRLADVQGNKEFYRLISVEKNKPEVRQKGSEETFTIAKYSAKEKEKILSP